MKKKTILFTSLALSFLTLGSVFSFANKMENAFADEQRTVYTDVGPGVMNMDSPNAGDTINVNNYSIAFRGAPNQKYLMMFPNAGIYEGVPFSTNATSYEMVDTNLSMIRIYTSPTKYKTAKELVATYGAPVQFNIFQDACLNVSIPCFGIAADEVYMVTIAEGFVYPYAPSSSHDVKYVQSRTLNLTSSKYGSGASDIVNAGDWLMDREISGDVIPLSVDACSSDRSFGQYRAHIRGNEPFGDQTLYDNGSCYLLIFFGEGQYNPEINGRYNITVASKYFDVSENNNSFLNTLYRKIHFETKQGEQLTLEDVSNPKTKGLPEYNIWGENNCLAFKIGNLNYLGVETPYYVDDVSYCATSFASMTIEGGTEFPCFATTNGDSIKNYRYVQSETIKVDISGGENPYWMVHSDLVFAYGDSLVTNVSASEESFTYNDEQSNKTFIHITLDNTNYAGLSNAFIKNPETDLLRYVYVNGRSLKYKNESTVAVVNLNGRTNTISLSVDGETSTSIKEIIVQKGCYIPSTSSDENGVSAYGKTAYFNVAKTGSYSRNNSSEAFTKTSSLEWTLWFEGANPKKVGNAKYFNMSNAPIPEKDGFTFLGWLDEDGKDVTGNIQVYSGKEFFAKYEQIHTVTLINDKDVTIAHAKTYTRLTYQKDLLSKLYPHKDGYQFLGWFDEDDNFFNIDNQILRDMTLTAKYEKLSGDASSKGCNGSIGITSSIVASISLLATGLVIKKKKEK